MDEVLCNLLLTRMNMGNNCVREKAYSKIALTSYLWLDEPNKYIISSYQVDMLTEKQEKRMNATKMWVQLPPTWNYRVCKEDYVYASK